MKKVILSLVVVVLATIGVKAQDHGSANVKVNLVLNPVLTISLGDGATAGEDVVDLVYASEEDYVEGVTKSVADQLQVTSIGSGYSLSAAVTGYNNGAAGKFDRIGGSEVFDASELLTIKVANGTAVNGAATMSFGDFGDNASATSVLAEQHEVTYKGTSFTGKEDLLRDMLAEGNNSVTYSALVVYTVETL